MRITVFGASGKIGRLAVERLLSDGHEVTAYVRDPGKLSLTHPRLTVLTGELTDSAAVIEAIAGADAVISALGPSLRRGARGTPVSDGTREIVRIMQESGPRRFIGLATPSVRDPQDKDHWKHKVLPVMVKVLFPQALVELSGMAEAITRSGLDWTLGRITNPTDRRGTGTIRSGFLGRDAVGSAMSRADIARFLVDQLDDTRYLKSAPAVSN